MTKIWKDSDFGWMINRSGFSAILQYRPMWFFQGLDGTIYELTSDEMEILKSLMPQPEKEVSEEGK